MGAPRLTLNGDVMLEPAKTKLVFPAPLFVKYSTVCGGVPSETADEAVRGVPDRNTALLVGAIMLTDTGSVAATVILNEKLSIWLATSTPAAALSSAHNRNKLPPSGQVTARLVLRRKLPLVFVLLSAGRLVQCPARPVKL